MSLPGLFATAAQSDMKAVILSVTSGEGHNVIAKVIASELHKRNVQTEIVDIFKHDGFEYRFNNWGYLFLCKYLPRSYDFCWKILKFRKSTRRYHGTAQREVQKVAEEISRRVDKLEQDSSVDFFVCVHPYTAILCDYWKRCGKHTNKKAFAVLTDLLPHPLWESAIKCDYVLTPTRDSFDQLQMKGFSPQQLIDCGFPTTPKTTEQTGDSLRQKLNLANKFTVMIISGGFGIGNNNKVAKLLLKNDVQILCMNGRNKKAYNKTQKLAAKHSNVRNYAFVDNLEELMGACDVVVSRGGAGTLFCAMSVGLPIVAREGLIINERENAEILQNAGALIKLKKLSELPCVIADLQTHPEKLQAMRTACQEVTQNRNVVNVCDKMLELL